MPFVSNSFRTGVGLLLSFRHVSYYVEGLDGCALYMVAQVYILRVYMTYIFENILLVTLQRICSSRPTKSKMY